MPDGYDVADALSEALIARRLVAATNCYAEISSRYIWKGKVETATEIPLVAKTRKDLFSAVAQAVRELHPYETPSIIATEIVAANQEYVEWIMSETVSPSEKRGGRDDE